MIQAVLDVNVIVSGFAGSLGPPGSVIDQWLKRRFEIIASEHILERVEWAWQSVYFRRRYSETDASDALSELRKRATIVVPVGLIRGIADDDEDDKVIETAIVGGAPLLVTGDQGLLKVGIYETVTLLSPRDFLQLLENETA